MDKIPDDISEIDQRIRAMQNNVTGTPKHSQRYLFVDTAIRAITEFVAPIIVGMCLGFVIDLLLNSSPIATIIFILLGCAAGILNIYRMGKQIEKRSNQ